MSAPTFVIASLPGQGRANPYVDLFYDALQAHGVELYSEPTIDLEWGRQHFTRIDALHFHWPEWIWLNAKASTARPDFFWLLRARLPGFWRADSAIDRLRQSTLYRRWSQRTAEKMAVQRFSTFLSAAKQSGVRVIWTMHNAEGHDSWSRRDRAGFLALSKRADLVIYHSEDARQECLRRYGPSCPVVVMPHGNYNGVYPAPRPRDEVLAAHGLDPALPVAGCIGSLRRNKGIDVAVRAVQQLRGEMQLICAGKPHRMFQLDELEQLVMHAPGIALVPKMLSDQEFADLSSACDVLLLPYREITGSGALLAALTFGRGVIVSDLPYFREVLTGNEDVGLLVPADDPHALADGIRRYLAVAPSRRSAAALQLAAKYAWPEVVKPVVTELRRLHAAGKPCNIVR